MSEKNSRWSRLELLKVLCLYASLSPERNGNPTNEEIKAMAEAIGRSESSISLRIANYIARDKRMQEIGHKDMFGGGVEVDILWKELSDKTGYLQPDKILKAIAFISTTA
jgi:hypothetical protein